MFSNTSTATTTILLQQQQKYSNGRSSTGALKFTRHRGHLSRGRKVRLLPGGYSSPIVSKGETKPTFDKSEAR